MSILILGQTDHIQYLINMNIFSLNKLVLGM